MKAIARSSLVKKRAHQVSSTSWSMCCSGSIDRCVITLSPSRQVSAQTRLKLRAWRHNPSLIEQEGYLLAALVVLHKS